MKSNEYIYCNNHLWVSKLSFNKYHDGKLCLPLISCVSANICVNIRFRPAVILIKRQGTPLKGSSLGEEWHKKNLVLNL